MNDFDLYASGMMNPDEQAQWDRVTEMMAARGEHDGNGPAQRAYEAMQGDPCAGDDGYEEGEWIAEQDAIEARGGPIFRERYSDDEIPY